MQRWTDNEALFLKENYNKMSHEEIGKRLNRTETCIRAKCFDLNLKKTEQWNKKELEILKKYYSTKTLTELSQIIGRTKNAIKVKASKIGIKKSEYTCNYRYFEKIDNPDKAYWLGFIYADGWININKKTGAGVFGLELQITDKKHLEKLSYCLQSNYKISTRERICALSKYTDKLNKTCILRIYSRELVDDLIRLGVTQHKTYELHSLPNINPILMNDFIRGFFDGDGCVRERTRIKKNGMVSKYLMLLLTKLIHWSFVLKIQRLLILQ